ncbi:type II secretion system protein GspD [Aggregatibacter actinomycetemcomitans]|uniref:type II secretion system protein GspD n=1 Tax=Aggregatibacter actinomycetemcomitans TaxID=714 RepID=UPI00197B337D|nr:type II secretion system protein GspD [Aggregatibacter actinomycetemcomitans]MBN6078803.1 type II secretion system protein GspD [Aggregatibacter actinomycetemcomitans]
MKKGCFSILLGLLSLNIMAKNVDFKLDSVPLPKAINIIYDEVLEKPFMMSPVLVQDQRKVSFKVTQKEDFEKFVQRYLQNLNVKVYTKNGVDYLEYVEPKIQRRSFVYTPIYRNANYLADLLKSNIEGDNGQSVTASADKLVYYGTAEDIARVKNVLVSADTKGGEVVVTGYVYEVQTEEKEGTGINLLAKLLSGKLGISIGAKQNYENFITIHAGNLDAMIELFNTDTRFNVVSSPTLRVKSGSAGNFSVGADVPVISDFTERNGKIIQSVQYRQSGVIFNIEPVVKTNAIDLKINQQLSNFIKTDTGVNNTPTLIKRDLVTDVTVKSGDVIVLGGLAQNKLNETETGFSFFPKGLFTGKSKSNEKTDIVVLLQVRLVD